MNRMSASFICWCAALFAQGCAMQPEKAPASQQREAPTMSRDMPSIITEQQLAQLKAIYPELHREYSKFREVATVTTYVPCATLSDEYMCIPITLFQWYEASGAGPYCVGIVPAVVKLPGTLPGNGEKKIAWQLVLRDPTAPVLPTGSYFEFLGDGDQGILVFKNIGNGATRQLDHGQRHPTTNTRFRITNKHTKTGTASYLPIVVHVVPATDPAEDDKVGLCGTPDPRIVNE